MQESGNTVSRMWDCQYPFWYKLSFQVNKLRSVLVRNSVSEGHASVSVQAGKAAAGTVVWIEGWILASHSYRKGCLSAFALQNSLPGTKFWLDPSQCLSFRSTRISQWIGASVGCVEETPSTMDADVQRTVCAATSECSQYSIWRWVMTVSRD